MSKLNAKEFIEGLEGYNVDRILDDKDLKLAVISIMEEYHQYKLKNNGHLGDVSVSFPSKEEVETAAVNCNPEDVNINADYHFEAGVLWLKSYILKSLK